MSKNLRVAGVVVLYNPSNDDISNIDTYISEIDVLYVVDNSECSPYKDVFSDKKKIIYICDGGNIGVSKALNIAAKKAYSSGYKWLLTMDQDTKFKTGCLEKMKKYILDNDTSRVGIVSPWHKTKLIKKKPDDLIDYPLDVMTSGNLVNLEILDNLGYFDERLFIDGIDIEYGLRLNSKGFKIVRLNSLEIDHELGDIRYHSFFGKELLSMNHNYLRQYYMARNYRYIRDMYVKDYEDFCKVLVKQKQNMFVILFYEQDKFRKIRYILKGIKDYKKGIIGKINL